MNEKLWLLYQQKLMTKIVKLESKIKIVMGFWSTKYFQCDFHLDHPTTKR